MENLGMSLRITQIENTCGKNCIFAFSHVHVTTCSYCLHLCSIFFWLGFTLVGHEISIKRKQLYKINIVTYAPDRWKLHNPNSCYRHNKDLSNTKKLGNRENREPNAGELEKQMHDNFKTNLYAQIARQRTTRNTIQVKAATWSGQGLHYIYLIWEVNMHLKKWSLSNKTFGPGYLAPQSNIHLEDSGKIHSPSRRTVQEKHKRKKNAKNTWRNTHRTPKKPKDNEKNEGNLGGTIQKHVQTHKSASCFTDGWLETNVTHLAAKNTPKETTEKTPSTWESILENTRKNNSVKAPASQRFLTNQ